MNSNRKKEVSEVVLQVGNRINQLIKEGNIKQRDVAYDAGLDVENLRKYIKGKQEMKISTMIKIVKALHIKVADLFEDVDVKF